MSRNSPYVGRGVMDLARRHHYKPEDLLIVHSERVNGYLCYVKGEVVSAASYALIDEALRQCDGRTSHIPTPLRQMMERRVFVQRMDGRVT